ncbi:DUF5658 family protein [Cytobacillus pseudoceanisediminis]
MKKMLNYLALLNLLDGFITALGLHFNVIEESNPLMRDLYDLHPFIFLFLKITFSGLLIIVNIYLCRIENKASGSRSFNCVFNRMLAALCLDFLP